MQHMAAQRSLCPVYIALSVIVWADIVAGDREETNNVFYINAKSVSELVQRSAWPLPPLLPANGFLSGMHLSIRSKQMT